MKPDLVDYDKFFQKKELKKIKKVKVKQINDQTFYFNLLSIIIIISGSFLLYYRRKNREMKEKKNIQNIIQFYQDVN